MIEFTCPGCLMRCIANGAFCGVKARCDVCGSFIRIPTETGEVAFPLGPLPSGPLPSTPVKSAAKRRKTSPKEHELLVLNEEHENEPDEEDCEDAPNNEDTSEGEDELTPGYSLQTEGDPSKDESRPGEEKSESQQSTTSAKSTKAKKSRSDWSKLESEADAMEKAEEEAAWNILRDNTEESPEQAAERAKQETRRKRKRFLLMGVGCLVASVIIASVIVFVTGDGSPKPLPSTGPPVAPDATPPTQPEGP